MILLSKSQYRIEIIDIDVYIDIVLYRIENFDIYIKIQCCSIKKISHLFTPDLFGYQSINVIMTMH